MRKKVAHPDVSLLRYGIRELVELAQKLQALIPGFRFIGENIGDPVAKGWKVPPFMKRILADALEHDDAAFAYTHSRGNIQTRKWVAEYVRRHCPASRLDFEDVLFFNGLGSAIAVLYQMMAPGARVLQPLPGYPAHISMERFFARSECIGYRTDPERDWAPDMADMERLVAEHPEAAAILLINPNNPTGAVYSRETLEAVVRLAERHHLMLISDEVYFRMVFNGSAHVHLIELAAGRVPLIVLRGVSKDVPWPGGRCGWMEFHNTDMDPDFRDFADSLRKRMLVEVCATTLPQIVLPRIYDHPEFAAWLDSNNRELEAASNRIAALLGSTRGLSVRPIHGAFYMLPVFKEGVLNSRQSLPIAHAPARDFIERAVSAPGFPPDKRFAFYLLASTGICVVPATDFESPLPGFRVTTLDRDPDRREKTYTALSRAVEQYLASA